VRRLSARDKACRNCKKIVHGNICDNCGSTNLTTNYSGLFILLLPEESRVAQSLGVKKPGHYAVKLS